MRRREVLAGAAGLAVASVAFATQPVQTDLYQCEGCEGALERKPDELPNRTHIGSAKTPGPKLRIEGVVYGLDSKPARDVVLYAYQTNIKGLYANGTQETTWSRRHGALRGWLKTGADGSYIFDTIKPAPYPNDIIPAHVHFTVLEPNRRPYWIDDVVFDGEFGVTEKYRASMINRGGNGIVALTKDSSGVLVAKRDIFLERHPARP